MLTFSFINTLKSILARDILIINRKKRSDNFPARDIIIINLVCVIISSEIRDDYKFRNAF